MEKTAIPSRPEQRRIIAELNRSSAFTVGQCAHLISCSWYNSFRSDDYPSLPGPIDNSALLGPDGLVPTACEGTDYDLLAAPVYGQLHCWFGGGPDVTFPIIAHPDGSAVAARPFQLTICHAPVDVHNFVVVQDLLDQLVCSDVNVFDGIDKHQIDPTKTVGECQLLSSVQSRNASGSH